MHKLERVRVRVRGSDVHRVPSGFASLYIVIDCFWESVFLPPYAKFGLVHPPLHSVAVYDPDQPLQPPQALHDVYPPFEHVRVLERVRTRVSPTQSVPTGEDWAYLRMDWLVVEVSASPWIFDGAVQPFAHEEYAYRLGSLLFLQYFLHPLHPPQLLQEPHTPFEQSWVDLLSLCCF